MLEQLKRTLEEETKDMSYNGFLEAEVETPEALRDLAIEWQRFIIHEKYFAKEGLSYGEVAAIENKFREHAEKFDMVEELEENAII